MQQPSEQPNWGAPELPAHLQTAQNDVLKAMASRFGPKAKHSASMHLAHAREAFQDPALAYGKTLRPGSITPVVPSASVSALWGWTSGDPQ